ncbi:hypothetical protein [Tatumella sp. JGM118]|uniref:Uncharacterized protein n=1 Tax=Tatumella terrea TaxID=419007 RepID=A0ABW1W3U9_9GAMM|nr:hypothetical protein [Tatumella sp. JGM118]MBS0908605.1 hypothetical protein [Tatumella sp. JGM118]
MTDLHQLSEVISGGKDKDIESRWRDVVSDFSSRRSISAATQIIAMAGYHYTFCIS